MSDGKKVQCLVTLTDMGDGSWYYSADCEGHHAGGALNSLRESAASRILDAVQYVTDKARWDR